jgi:hypothetical protein
MPRDKGGDSVDDSVNPIAGFRRRAAIGGGALLTLASLIPVSASAAAPLHTPKVPVVAPAGVVSNLTHAIRTLLVLPGDYVSMGWTISLPRAHPATTVTVSDIVATIPMTCESREERSRVLNLVIRAPQTTVTLPADDATWHATSNTAIARAYQAKILVGELCPRGVLEPHGNASYAAKLVSTDSKDPYAIRFHTVDARTNLLRLGELSPNTDCTSLAQNPNGVAQCNAAWTSPTRVLALAAPVIGGGTGGVGGVVGGVTGTTGKVVGGVAGSVGAVVSHTVHPVLHHRTSGVSQGAVSGPAQQPGGVSAATTHPAPVLVLPPPSQSAVLGPVPLPVPVIDSVAAGVGGALPWKWFLLLAIVDVALIVAIFIRRRLGQHDRLNPR